MFLGGLVAIRSVCAKPALTRFRWQELGVLLVWGQVTEFVVEAVSVLNGAWVYSEAVAYDPVLFHIAGHPITLVPQLIWFVAPVIYYVALLNLVVKPSRSSPR